MRDSLKREMKEETTLNPFNIKQLGIKEIIIKSKQKHYLIIYYSVEAKSKDVVLSEEHDEYKWINFSELFKFELNPILKLSKSFLMKK